MDVGIRWYIFLPIFIAASVQAQDWEDPPFLQSDDERVVFGEYFTGTNAQALTMDEELTPPINIVEINYKGSTAPVLTSFSAGSNDMLGARFVQPSDEENWLIVVNNTIDYELMTGDTFLFDITINGVMKSVTLNIINIDDNPPVIVTITNPCQVDENYIGETNCSYEIRDEDGWLDYMNWTVSGTRNEENLFKFEYENDIPSNSTTSATVKLFTMGELDYQTITIHIINWTVSDSVHSTSQSVVVNVNDLPDTPPVWTSIFSTEQFDEKTEKSFTVNAIDGDMGINNDIMYRLDSEWGDLFDINSETGEIRVDGIDRDATGIEIYTFLIIAIEVQEPNSTTNQSVTFIVNDINDQIPTIVQPVGSELEITIPEAMISTISDVIVVNDMDSSVNAVYRISLLDPTSTGYNDAFQAVPNQGVQEYNFSLSIVNSGLLDYEDEQWRSFSFQFFVQETVNSSHIDNLTVKIALTNWNDESPIFEQEEYIVQVNETIGIDELIKQVLATDRDVDDTVVHSIIGTSANRLFAIDNETGIITTKIQSALDYERQTEVLIQVAATDTLNLTEYCTIHTTYAQVTIEVLDINDEPPSISVYSVIEIEENQPNDTDILANIIATDEDTTAELVFEIDWTSSYATKSGRVINDLGNYTECIVVTTTDISEGAAYGYARANLLINEVVKDNTPDYEVFDTLYLALTVKDINQEVGTGTASVTVSIFIIDVNDNAPEFTDSITNNNTVTESAIVGTTIGTITATDADGPNFNTVWYYIKEIDETPLGLVVIDNSTGQLTVASQDIDADDPHMWYLNYSVTASDGELNNTANIQLYIIDINDNPPIFEQYDTGVEVKEKSDNGTYVHQIIATDKDRDSPYNVVWYQFTTATTTSEVGSFFSMDIDTGLVIVDYKSGQQLDRDDGTSHFIVNFRAADNYYSQGPTQYETSGVFNITLADINDQYPIIETTEITVSESYKKDQEISTPIIAFDKDQPGTNNTKINFTITSITDENGDELSVELFSIATDEEYATGYAYLTTLVDLEGYFGEYALHIETNDFGNPSLTYSNILTLKIEKYNFYGPVFIYPTEGQRVFLSKSQDFDSTLILYNEEKLPYIQADDRQDGKWDITFSIETDEETNVQDIFYINNADTFGQSTGELQLKARPDVDAQYTLRIIANDNGNPTYTETVELAIRFFDSTSLPYFSENERELHVQFTENSTGLTESNSIYAASYNDGEEDWEFSIYYLLAEGDGELFSVDINSGEITLKQELDREEIAYHELKIVASNSESIPSNYDEKSVLVVTVEVLDINDNPPHFNSSRYSAGISTNDLSDSVILTVAAYDLDISDVLTYDLVENSLTVSHSSISHITTPFAVDPNSGDITLRFSVQVNMEGYFTFEVVVTDSPPDNNTDTTKVTIHIISDENRVQFTFQNDLDTVVALQNTISSILGDAFNLTCNIENIASDADDNGELISTQTIVTSHFINSEEYEPISKTEIQSTLSNIEFFASLRSSFLNQTLYLLSYTGTTNTVDNTEENLRAWLIGVSVILGSICIMLLAAFIIKTRMLTQRLRNLSTTKFGSQESGLNRMGIAAPNTNKNAVEGSNPVYNEEKKMPDFDESSIHSGDSDLIGVEDNPEFDYDGVNNNAFEKQRY